MSASADIDFAVLVVNAERSVVLPQVHLASEDPLDLASVGLFDELKLVDALLHHLTETLNRFTYEPKPLTEMRTL